MNYEHVKAVFFDMDGTLTDSYTFNEHLNRDHFNRFQLWFIKKLQNQNISHMDDVMRIMDEHLVLRLCKPVLLHSLEKKVTLFYGQVELKPGAKQFLEYLKTQDIKLALCTNNQRKMAQIALRKHGIEDYFSLIISGDDVTHPKPHPEMYQKALDYFGISAHEALVFEDMLSGVQAARSLNIPVIAINEPHYASQASAIKEQVVMMMDDFTQPQLYEN
ncbi:MAG: HAD family hydrolase [Erysipelotrichaceae bacterium]